MDILASSDPALQSRISSFLDSWATVRAEKDAAYQLRVTESVQHSDPASQTAYLNLAARVDSIQQAQKEHGSVLKDIHQCTEVFSPSKASTSQQKLPISNYPIASTSSAPGFAYALQFPNHPIPSTSSAPPLHHPHDSLIPHVPLNFPTSSLPVTPTHQPSTLPARVFPQSPIPPPQPVAPVSPNTLVIYCFETNSRTYWILPAMGGSNPPKSPADMILPAADAFTPRESIIAPAYPEFTLDNRQWLAILGLICNPQHFSLWNMWGPGNLGDYRNIEDLWKVWDQGRAVSGVGLCPPLRMIEQRWGGTGRLQAWRPSNEPNVSCSLYLSIWSFLTILFRCVLSGASLHFSSIGLRT